MPKSEHGIEHIKMLLKILVGDVTRLDDVPEHLQYLFRGVRDDPESYREHAMDELARILGHVETSPFAQKD